LVIHENLSLQLLTAVPLILLLISVHIFLNKKMKLNIKEQNT